MKKATYIKAVAAGQLFQLSEAFNFWYPTGEEDRPYEGDFCDHVVINGIQVFPSDIRGKIFVNASFGDTFFNDYEVGIEWDALWGGEEQ